jgi:hypothetical protein
MRYAMLCIAVTALLSAAACKSMSFMPKGNGGATAFASTSKEQVVSIVNRNVTGVDGGPGLKSWRCMQAKFQMAPMPVAADGTVIVEAPQSFRLRVSHPIGGGDELDVGSNPRQFWIWQKDMDSLLTARHEDMSLALQHFRIPFQPDWIMEVMGVVPIDAANYQLQPAGSRNVELVATTKSPTGEPCKKVIRVDMRNRLVTAHELWSADGKAIATAEFSDHQPDPGTKSMLPRKIRINWPEADLDLRITLRHVEVNPPYLPEMVWQVPQKNGCRLVDMGDYARAQGGVPSEPPVRQVDHGVPAAEMPSATPTSTADSPLQSAALIPGDEGARPFPGMGSGSAPSPAAAPALPSAGDPLEPTGRVRLNDIGS